MQLERTIQPSSIVRERVIKYEIKYKKINVKMYMYIISIEKGQCITSGSNIYGQLGHTHPVPAIVPKLASVSRVSCGDNFTIAATKGGRVKSH